MTIDKKCTFTGIFIPDEEDDKNAPCLTIYGAFNPADVVESDSVEMTIDEIDLAKNREHWIEEDKKLLGDATLSKKYEKTEEFNKQFLGEEEYEAEKQAERKRVQEAVDNGIDFPMPKWRPENA